MSSDGYFVAGCSAHNPTNIHSCSDLMVKKNDFTWKFTETHAADNVLYTESSKSVEIQLKIHKKISIWNSFDIWISRVVSTISCSYSNSLIRPGKHKDYQIDMFILWTDIFRACDWLLQIRALVKIRSSVKIKNRVSSQNLNKFTRST